MKIKVGYYNLLREITGVREETIEHHTAVTLQELIELIASKHGQPAAKTLLRETGGIAPHITVFVNNKLVHDPAQMIGDGACVALFLAVIGG